MGPYRGGQAEYLRVPFADFNALQLPDDSVDKENDYVMLADIFPTGWHGTRLAKVQPGDSVAVWGAGPVGLMAAYSAVIQGAAAVFVVDHIAERLALAEKFGAVGVDSSKTDPVESITEATGGEGVDRGVEAVGYQAHDASGNERSNLTMNALVEVVRPTGGIGVVGVFLPEDPGAADELAKQGKMAFDFGKFFFKGQTIATGQANVKNYNRYLRELIHHDRAAPSRLVSHNRPGRGAGCLPALRQSRPGLDQGRAQSGEALSRCSASTPAMPGEGIELRRRHCTQPSRANGLRRGSAAATSTWDQSVPEAAAAALCRAPDR